MSSTSAETASFAERFSLPLFAVTVALGIAGLAVLFAFMAPASVVDAQVSAPWWKLLLAFVAMKAVNSFVEFFFHRYVLHKPLIPFLARFYRQHTKHHALTRIGRRRTPGGREVPVIENAYPIKEEHQHEASFFPWYTLAAFAVVMTPLYVLLNWVAPSYPWFLAGYVSLAASLVVYEVCHAIEHWPFERWAPLLEHRIWGPVWRHLYGFHLRHHAVIDCNEAISGFFTFPLPDLVFGTWVNPKTLFLDGTEWKSADFVVPRPRRAIRWLDGVAERRVTQRRRKLVRQ